MHYAIPAILAKAGMLEHFYTDICGNKGISQILKYIFPETIRPKQIKRLLGRKLPEEVDASLVTTSELRSFIYPILQKLQTKGIKFGDIASPEETVQQKILKDDFLNANALYTNLINSDLNVVQKAREKNIKIVHEVIISPEVPYVIQEERSRFPGIENQDDISQILEGTERDRQKWSMSDLILVPSEYVKEGIIRLGGDAERIAVVPYGISEKWFSYQPKPQRGRILFVGSVGLRKGNHYLAQASRILQQRGLECQVRVLGPYDPHLITRAEFQGPLYVGQVPRSEIIDEFLKADIFVLPTLCEGMALVHLEALACGLPVITTPNCGSVVRDGVDGFIVPIRDAEALAERIEQLLTNDSLRNQLSENARMRAREFTWEKYSDRLLNAVKNFENN
jgi:glycosyltransferase involved in cell wall biosynthesis